jgi:hypothetical protein
MPTGLMLLQTLELLGKKRCGGAGGWLVVIYEEEKLLK